MKRTSLRRKAKGRTLKQIAEDAEKKLEELRMWNSLKERYLSLPLGDRKCQSCGKKLAEEPRTYYFDHLIEKNRRPDLASEWDNIFLCCLECHSLKTEGFPTDPHRKAIEKAKEKFGVN